MRKVNSFKICPHCSQKINPKYCRVCGVEQTEENSGRNPRNGNFYSSCLSCERKRVLHTKYKTMGEQELIVLRDKHLKAAEEVAKYLLDAFPKKDI